MGQISKIIYDNLDVSITKLGNFDVVPRTEMAAIANESRVQAVLNNQTVALPATTPRYLLIYNVMQFSFEPKNVQVVDQGKLSDETANAMAIKDPIQKAIALAGVKAKATVWVKRHFGFVKLKMTMYDTKNKKRVYAQTLSGYSTASEQTPGLNGLINEAAENVVRDFMAQFAADFCPVAAVMMTKGSGQIAMLNIGRSHGVLKGSEIEFIEYMNIGKTMRAIPFAVGEVFEIDNESCWVEVKNYQNVRVRKFSVARIKPTQSKSSQINSL